MNHVTAAPYLIQADRSTEQMNRADLMVRPLDMIFVQYHLNAFTSEGCSEGCSVCVSDSITGLSRASVVASFPASPAFSSAAQTKHIQVNVIVTFL